MLNKKIKLLWVSDGVSAATGLGNMSRRLLTRFWKSKKFEIFSIEQGMMKNNPTHLKYPWKSCGAVPDDQNNIHRMNSDPGFARAAAYGDAILEDVVKEFQPDIVFFGNDPWGASDIGVNKFFWNKIPCVSYNCYDSLPLYQPSLSHIDKLKNLYCWSTFAENEFHRLGHPHVKTMFPPMETDKYRILSDEEKIKNKNYLSVDENAFIISYVFRNQLRKQSHSVIQALSLIKNKYPDVYENIRFHMHTSGDEGWNHQKFCEQYNIDYSHLLYTWLCQTCKNIEVKPDVGTKSQDGKFAHKCKHCGGEQRTPSVGGGVTIDQMNQIFNLGDCFTLVGNSGASEMPGLESMSCGVPLATMNYSYGEDFCKNDFVFNLKFSMSVEFGTQFLKATPDPNSVMDFILKIYNLSKDERKEIGLKSRNWIIENFDADLIANKWMQIFEEMGKTNWDFTNKETLKDPTAQIEDLPDNTQFIKQLYSKILKMEVLDSDSGLIHWLNMLKQGMPRAEIVNFFRKTGVDDNQKVQSKQNEVTLDKLIDNNGKKKLLIVAPDSIGDLINIKGLLPSFYKNYPPNNWSIYFATKPEYFEIFEDSTEIHKLIPYHPSMDSEIFMTGQGNNKGLFDAYSFVTSPTQKFLNYLTNNNIILPKE